MTVQLSPQLTQIALTFLERSELRGAEVPAYNAIVNTLQQIAAPTAPDGHRRFVQTPSDQPTQEQPNASDQPASPVAASVNQRNPSA